MDDPASQPVQPQHRFFKIDSAKRRKHLAIAFFKSFFGIGFSYVGVRLSIVKPSFHISYWAGALIVLIPAYGVYLRSRWGTAIEFQDYAIDFFRGDTPTTRVFRDKITEIQIKEHSVAIWFKECRRKRAMLICPDGFAEDDWKQFCEQMERIRLELSPS